MNEVRDWDARRKADAELLEAIGDLLKGEGVMCALNYGPDPYLSIRIPAKCKRWDWQNNSFEAMLDRPSGNVIVRPIYLSGYARVFEMADPEFPDNMIAYARTVPDWNGLPS